VFAFLLLICISGVSGERDLAAASKVWPRFREKRPQRWLWQTVPYRAELIATGVLASAALLLAGAAIAPGTVALICFAGGLLVGGLTTLVYVVRLRPLARSWRKESNFASKWTQRKRRTKRALLRLRELAWVIGR